MVRVRSAEEARMLTVDLGGRPIGTGQPCYVIAEAGVNHNGSVETATRLVDVAVEAGADAVKFQKRTVEDILVREALDRPYTGLNSFGATYREHRERLELSEDDYRALARYCSERKITLLASVWDQRSADFINSLRVPAFKIASADLTNLPLLEHVAKLGKPMIVSTGMSTLDEVDDAVKMVHRYLRELVLLHCVSTYPAESRLINLRVMETLRQRYPDVPIGYSGHEKSGFAVTEAAVALGAVVVERHFTLDRTMPGPDHAASLEPLGLKRLIANLRDIEQALGSDEKDLREGEMPVRMRLAKSIASKCAIPAGSRIEPEMLTVKGPGDGLRPKCAARLVGRIAPMDIPADTLFPLDALGW